MFNVWAMLGLWVLTVAPLPEAAQRQADSYLDGLHPDQPALYALLADVAAWDAGDDAGAVVPDWEQIRDHPKTHRGQALLIEGVDAGRRRRIALVRPQPPWGDAVTEWGVVVTLGEAGGTATTGSNGSDGDAEPVADALPVVVWFFDPDDAVGASVEGRRVRLVGRFLGWWDDEDAHGYSQRYPVVVAKSAVVVERAGSGSAVVGWPVVGLAAFVLVALWLWWRLGRMWSGQGVVARQRGARESSRRETREEDEERDDIDLPDDAASALDALDRRDRTE